MVIDELTTLLQKLPTWPDASEGLGDASSHRKPLWMYDARSYLLAFARHRHEASDDSLPQDRRILRAIRRLYRDVNEPDRQIMRGNFRGSRNEQKWRFNRLCVLVAIQAGLTAWAVVPPAWEEMEPGRSEPGESEG